MTQDARCRTPFYTATIERFAESYDDQQDAEAQIMELAGRFAVAPSMVIRDVLTAYMAAESSPNNGEGDFAAMIDQAILDAGPFRPRFGKRV